jgi:hypothetical protein
VGLLVLALMQLAPAQRTATGGQLEGAASLSCDQRLTALFTPKRPQLGRYEVCTTEEALASFAPPGWRIEALAPLDAFGSAGAFNRSAMARLFGGRRASVARGWIRHAGRFESLTLISPYPDPTLTRLMPGTLVVRFIICCP